MKKFLFSVFLLWFGAAVLLAGWNSPPPTSSTVGTGITVNVSGDGNGDPINFLMIWVQSPNGTWASQVAGSAGGYGTINSGNRNYTFTAGSGNSYGVWNWDVRVAPSSGGSSPSGTQVASGSTTVTAPTTFSFGNLSHTYDGGSKTASVTPTPGGATYSSDLTKGPGTGSYTVSATATGYFTGSGSATLTISSASQATLTLNASTTQTYGTSQTISASGGSGSGGVTFAITGQSAGGAASLVGTSLTANVSSGWVDLQATKAGDSNYLTASSATVRVNFTIVSATFSFSNLTHTYDGSTKTATVTPTPGSATYSSDLTKGPNVGSYTVSASATGNYTGSGSGTLTIGKANQTITFANPGTQTYGTPLNLVASASSGLAVAFAVTSGPASVSGNTLTFTAPGNVTITSSQGGDSNYNAATNVSQTFTVNKATPAGNFANRTLFAAISSYTVVTGDLNAAFTGPGGASAPTGTITYNLVGPGTTVAAGTVLPIATYTVRASYPGDTNYNATTKDATWIVSNDTDGDGVPDYLETALGTSTSTANATDSGAATSLKIHKPN